MKLRCTIRTYEGLQVMGIGVVQYVALTDARCDIDLSFLGHSVEFYASFFVSCWGIFYYTTLQNHPQT